jgi:hypothetical protein
MDLVWGLESGVDDYLEGRRAVQAAWQLNCRTLRLVPLSLRPGPSRNPELTKCSSRVMVRIRIHLCRTCLIISAYPACDLTQSQDHTLNGRRANCSKTPFAGIIHSVAISALGDVGSFAHRRLTRMQLTLRLSASALAAIRAVNTCFNC